MTDYVIRTAPSGRPVFTLDLTPEDWAKDALCAQADPEAFFPERGTPTTNPKTICAACDVQADCLGYALRHNEKYGIWGGTSPKERQRLRRTT